MVEHRSYAQVLKNGKSVLKIGSYSRVYVVKSLLNIIQEYILIAFLENAFLLKAKRTILVVVANIVTLNTMKFAMESLLCKTHFLPLQIGFKY